MRTLRVCESPIWASTCQCKSMGLGLWQTRTVRANATAALLERVSTRVVVVVVVVVAQPDCLLTHVRMSQA